VRSCPGFSVEHVLPSTDCPNSEGFKSLQSSDSAIEGYTGTCRLRQSKHYWTGRWDLYPDPSRCQIRPLALACKRKAARFRKRLYFYVSTSSVCLGVLRPLAGIDFDFAADDKPTNFETILLMRKTRLTISTNVLSNTKLTLTKILSDSAVVPQRLLLLHSPVL
jgi:hypothetical protein